NAIELLEASGKEIVIGARNTFRREDGTLSPLIKRASLSRQLWSWSGRQYSASPADGARIVNRFTAGIFSLQPRTKTGEDKEDGEKWNGLIEGDGEWFGDRTDDDSLKSDGLLTLPPPDSFRSGDAGVGHDKYAIGDRMQAGPQHRIPLDRDRRAQYWRYS